MKKLRKRENNKTGKLFSCNGKREEIKDIIWGYQICQEVLQVGGYVELKKD